MDRPVPYGSEAALPEEGWGRGELAQLTSINAIVNDVINGTSVTNEKGLAILFYSLFLIPYSLFWTYSFFHIVYWHFIET
ncbi:MAG: hypothetical protein NZ480_09225 [Bdellovibrionaceae bacterium]|nr:hypothetical protein [Pseudobdellovibrionaceae bacterium]MDW8190997.1 hypothetical protein [Pseudobdellovibrionaceae bacterium]